MSEKTILVCDVCGRPAVETVTIKLSRGNFAKDLCTAHVNELIGGARKPKRGRPRASASAPAPTAKRRGRPPGSKTKTTAKRRGRPRKRQAAS